jgi:hypothetical protein
MRRLLYGSIVALTLGGVAPAQPGVAPGGAPGPAGSPGAPAAGSSGATTASTPSLPGANANEPPAAPLPYLFAGIFTIVTLTILCMPTRKA